MFSRLLPLAIISLLLNIAFSQPPQGSSLLPGGINDLLPGRQAIADSVVKPVAVAGQSFSEALEVNTFKKSLGKDAYGLSAKISTPLLKGDVLWISFKARTLESKRETGEAFVELRFDQLVNANMPGHLTSSGAFLLVPIGRRPAFHSC